MPAKSLDDDHGLWIGSRPQVPAWLLSLALHLTVALLAGLLIERHHPPAGKSELVRPAAIAIARSNPSQPAQYYSAEDSPVSPPASFAAAAAAVDQPLDAPPPAAGIELPQSPGAAADGGLFVIRPSLSTGSGAGRLSGLSAADVASILAEDAARHRDAGPKGPTARLSLFGSAAAEGRSFVFLLDCSQSMGHQGLGAIAAAAKELQASIHALGPEQSFQVIAYNQQQHYLGGRELLAATPENREKLVEFVAGTVAVGATEHERGLFAALRLRPEVIFVFTDGGDPGLNAGQLRAIRSAAGARTAIHALHFGSGPRRPEGNFLVRLAEQNRGSYSYVDMQER